MAKRKEISQIIEQTMLAPGIYSMWLKTEEIALLAKPGQFLSVYSKDGSRLLPRPISICEIDREHGNVRIVYRIAGKGTEEFSHYKAGDSLDVLGPLGNGFPIERMKEGKTAVLVGGGIGIPPMLQLAKEGKGEIQIVVGYRDSQTFLQKELETVGTVTIATDDGSIGTHGTVIDAIKQQGLKADVIFACGPTPMLRGLKQYAEEQQIECWISMEEKMACGIGACLACVCQSKEVDDHSKVLNKRVCKEGPVFLATEVEL